MSLAISTCRNPRSTRICRSKASSSVRLLLYSLDRAMHCEDKKKLSRIRKVDMKLKYASLLCPGPSSDPQRKKTTDRLCRHCGFPKANPLPVCVAASLASYCGRGECPAEPLGKLPPGLAFQRVYQAKNPREELRLHRLAGKEILCHSSAIANRG